MGACLPQIVTGRRERLELAGRLVGVPMRRWTVLYGLRTDAMPIAATGLIGDVIAGLPR